MNTDFKTHLKSKAKRLLFKYKVYKYSLLLALIASLDRFVPTMDAAWLAWFLDYLVECMRRGEEPVWENQQLIDKLQERTTPLFARRDDFCRDRNILTRQIKEHMAIWKAKGAQPQPPSPSLDKAAAAWRQLIHLKTQ